jgi:hypothetical protein
VLTVESVLPVVEEVLQKYAEVLRGPQGPQGERGPMRTDSVTEDDLLACVDDLLRVISGNLTGALVHGTRSGFFDDMKTGVSNSQIYYDGLGVFGLGHSHYLFRTGELPWLHTHTLSAVEISRTLGLCE